MNDPVQLGDDTEVDRLGYADDLDFMGELFVPRDEQMSEFRTASGRVGLHVKECKTATRQIVPPTKCPTLNNRPYDILPLRHPTTYCPGRQ